MIYSVDISTDEITTVKIASNLYLLHYFTLTVKTVNDAPIMLQPIEALEILVDSWVAAVVLNTV